jgi:thioredoxin 1
MKSLLLVGFVIFAAGCKRSSDVSKAAGSEPFETKHLTASEYESFIATPGRLTAVMFHADWCGPCRQLGPVVEEVVAEFDGKAVLGMIDVDESSDLANSLGVSGIPDLRLFRNGVMVDALKGAIPKEQVRNHFAIQVAEVSGAANAESETSPPESAIQPMKDDWHPPGLERR